MTDRFELARSNPERNRWPHEPEEGEEPSQEEREREWSIEIKTLRLDVQVSDDGTQ